MTDTPLSFSRESARTLGRLLPRVQAAFSAEIAASPKNWQAFSQRLEAHFPALFQLYHELYSGRYDFYYHLEDLLVSLARSWFARPADLRVLDSTREADPLWFQSNQMLGGVIYVDLFAGDLEGVRSKIAYFKELGLTYLHLMPLFKMPAGENDGGYAVSSYREVHPPLGTMEQLASLSRELRAAGISLVVDLVFNHTSDEHTWAEQAKAGDEEASEMYHIFPDRSLPDAYERTLREIFPDEHPGSFSPFSTPLPCGEGLEEKGWVWTTFHKYQWDLNYANPAVFNRMAEEMLFLANRGVEVIRLDAVAFIWKEMGTGCENLPQAHQLIRAFNTAARISAPALLFKSEAIVHPDDVVKYIDPAECQLSYNPLLMALLWNSLATRKVRLLSQALANRFKIHSQTAWVNYVRCHDDIGWTFSDDDAAHLGVNGYDHRRFLNDFYRGRFPGSFARGLPFQENPKTGDCRISGTCASLAGLEKALNEEGPAEVELAVRRILLIHGIILTIGGIPLFYLGDEIGTLNDYSYRDHPDHARDSRWVHRPKADWQRYANRSDPFSIEGRVFNGLRALIQLRKSHPAFSGNELEMISTENPHVLGYVRTGQGRRAVVFANFSESEQTLPGWLLDQYNCRAAKIAHGSSQFSGQTLQLAPFDLLILYPAAMIQIRPAVPSDSAAIARVQVDSYRSAYAGIFPDGYLAQFTYTEQEQDWLAWPGLHPADLLYVAEENGDILGYALGRAGECGLPNFDGELLALHVRREKHCCGIGRHLLQAVTGALHRQGCRSLLLWVLEKNPSRGFYEHLGGQLVGRQVIDLGEGDITPVEVAYGWPDIRSLLDEQGEEPCA